MAKRQRNASQSFHSRERQQAFAESQQKQNEIASRRYRRVCKHNRKAARQMFAKWWGGRLHDMEAAADHGDSRSLHQGVKQLLDLIANDGTSKKALSSNHQGDHERMTKHFHDILNITRSINNSVLECAPDFSHLGKLINWKEPEQDDVRWAAPRRENRGRLRRRCKQEPLSADA